MLQGTKVYQRSFFWEVIWKFNAKSTKWALHNESITNVDWCNASHKNMLPKSVLPQWILKQMYTNKITEPFASKLEVRGLT